MIKKLRERISVFINQRKEIPSEYPFIMFDEEKELLKKNYQKQ